MFGFLQSVLTLFRGQPNPETNRSEVRTTPAKTALLLVDIQNDFLPGGSLAVGKGREILDTVYSLIDDFKWDVIVATKFIVQDYHPSGHVSFASAHGKEPFTSIHVPRIHTNETVEQALWPDHCVQDSDGGAFEAGVQSRLERLSKDGIDIVYIRKGSDHKVDSYSAFADNVYSMFTRLPQELFSRGIEKVVIVGLATDYCVRATAIDARKFNFDTIVITDGVRGVFPDNEEKVLDELRRWGTRTVSLDEFAGCCKTS